MDSFEIFAFACNGVELFCCDCLGVLTGSTVVHRINLTSQGCELKRGLIQRRSGRILCS